MRQPSARWHSVPELAIGTFTVIIGYFFGVPMVMDSLIRQIGGEFRAAQDWIGRVTNGALLLVSLILVPIALTLVALWWIAGLTAWSLVNLISPWLADQLFNAKPDPTRIPPLRPA